MPHGFGFPFEVIATLAVVILLSVWLDLWVHRNAREISLRDAAIWSGFWVALSGCFGLYLRWRFSAAAASLFFAGWAMEKVLSVDNLLVFLSIFKYFRLGSSLQHRVLYYGILGAVVLRLAFVMVGSGVRLAGPYADVVFALVVGWSAVKMARGGGDADGDADDFSQHRVVRWAQRVFAVIPRLDGRRLIVSRERAEEIMKGHPERSLMRAASWYATPAFVCMILIEASDVMFAFDSVPTVIAVTREPVLVYSAMLFAVLGLRSLYFLLAALTRWLVHLEKAIIGLLFFIAAKLFLHASKEILHWPRWEISAEASLIVIAATLAVGVLASVIWPERAEVEETAAPTVDATPSDS